MLKIANYKLWVFLIFIEYLMYENVLFIFPDYFGGNLLKSIVFGYKLYSINTFSCMEISNS